MTPQQVKNNIDIDIISKTLQSSITPTDVGKNMKDIIDLIPATNTGPTGPQGPIGLTGPQGIQGIQGVPGQNGSSTPTNIVNGITTTVSGNGTVATPFIIETNNLQKVIPDTNYTLTPADNNYIIFINNGGSDISITIPTNLPTLFQCGFVQKGTGNVSFIGASGITLSNADSQYKIKNQFSNVFIERELNTNTFYLFGNTKV